MEQPNFNVDTQFLADKMFPVNTPSPIEDMVTDIRTKAQTPDVYKSLYESNSLFSPQSFKPEKRALKGFANESFDEAYDQLNSGEYVSRYQDFGFMPNTDNMERSANLQTTTDKWLNGVQKFGTKTLNAVIGGTLGTVNGIYEGVSKGSLNAAFDNDFNRWLDDLNTKMDYTLPNYYTKQEQEAGFFGSVGSANFWANDVLGASSFTVGAVISEGIWAYATGGASLATVGARWGTKALGFTKAAKGIGTYKGWLKEGIKNSYRAGNISKQAAIIGSQIAGTANFGRFLVTSSGYEAGIEALHFKKEAEENFMSEFQALNGRMPNEEEVQKFNEDVVGASNWVFGANMAILAPSNLAMFGSMFNIASPFKAASKGVNKSLFGVGVEKTAEGTFKTLQATKFQNVAQKAFPILKSTAVEGLYEEGMQSVATKTADAYITSTYDPKNTINTFGLVDAMYDGMAQTYGTKEGWKELGIGMLIGGAFGARGNYSEMSALKEKQEEIVKGENTFSVQKLAQSVLMTNQMQGAIERQKVAQDKGDRVGATIASNEAVLSQFAYKYKVGESLNDLVSEYSTALNGMTNEQFKQIGVEENEIQEYKDTVLNSFSDLAKRYEQNREFANRFLGVDKGKWAGYRDANQELTAEALTYTLTAGETVNEVMDDILAEMSTKIGKEAVDSINTQKYLEMAGVITKNEVNVKVRELKDLKNLVAQYEKTVRQIQNRPSKPSDVQGSQQQGDAYFNAAERLLEAQNKLIQKQAELDELSNNIQNEVDKRIGINKVSLNTSLNIPIITSDLLENLDENLKKVDNLVGSYKSSNPRTYEELAQLSKEYANAKEKFMNYQNSAIAMTNGNFKLKSSNSWLSKMLQKGVTLNEFTQEFLAEVQQNYAKALAEAQIQQNPQVVETVNPNKPTFERKTTPIQEPKSEVEKLKDRLKEALKNKFYPLIKVGQNYDELSMKMPTQSEIDEYGDLFSRGGEINRSKAEQERFEELNQKLGDWKLLDSAYTEGQSIADIVELISQLETQVEQQETVEEVTEQALEQVVSEEMKISGDVDDYTLGQNTNNTPTVKLVQDGTKIRFHHIKPQTIVDRLNPESVDSKRPLDKLKEGDEVVLEKDGVKILLQIANGGRVIMDYEQFKAFQQSLNIYPAVSEISNYSNWTYHPVYEFNGSEFVPMESDFKDATINGDVLELEEGDIIDFTIDQNNEYNRKLLEEYNKKGASEEAKKELTKNVVVYFSKDGVNYQTAKASRGKTIPPNFLALREKAGEALINGFSGRVGQTKVTYVHLGQPQFSLQDGMATETEINPQAVETTGYFKDGKFTLANKTMEDKVRKSFVSTYAKSNSGRKIPIIVVRRGKQLIAFPISMKKTDASKLREFETILGNDAMNEVDKVKQINNLLISLNISPSKYELVDLQDQDKLALIQDELSNYKTFQTADNIADPNYKKEQIQIDATAKIDTNNLNIALPSTKISVSLEDITIFEDTDIKNDTLTELENSLSEQAIEIDRLLNPANGQESAFIDKKGEQIEDSFREVFDDVEVFRTPQNQLDILHNIKVLSQAIENITPAAKKFLGADRVVKIQQALDKLEFIRRQVKADVDKKTKKDLEC